MPTALATRTDYFALARTNRDGHPLSTATLTAAIWHGSLEWCGSILGPHGFLVLAFADKSASRAREHLLEQLNDKLAGWRTLPLGTPAAAESDRIDALIAALERFGQGVREDFAGIPLDYQLGTPFQQRVWRALMTIPWGETISYGDLATRIGQPTAARAVGSANGANPLAPVVPCHRVIQSGGSLGGYGGGLPLKSRLLAREGAFPAGAAQK